VGVLLLKKIDRFMSDISYLAKVGKLTSGDTEAVPQMKVLAMKEQHDIRAAVRSATRDEHVEMHNADKLGEEVIIDDDQPLNRKG